MRNGSIHWLAFRGGGSCTTAGTFPVGPRWGKSEAGRRRRTSFAALERWQTAYLPVYFAWAWWVVLAFPPLFAFR